MGSCNEIQGFKSIKEACKHYGVSEQKVYQLKHQGYSVNEALEIVISGRPVRLKHAIPVTVNGVEYESISKACKKIGLNYQSVINKAWIKKIKPEEVLTIIRKRSSMDNLGYGSIKKACAAYGVNVHDIYTLRHKGYTTKNAIEATLAKRVHRE